MLEKTPEPIGRLLRPLRAGPSHLAWEAEGLQAPETIQLSSAAFAKGASLPGEHTTDGRGTSPPLAWRNVPAGATEMALIVEDADSPSPSPLIHLLVWGLPAGETSIPSGAFSRADPARNFGAVGKNSFRKLGWLPPDPPTGHGRHRYVFQLFALDQRVQARPGADRHDVVEALRGHVLARGRVTAIYEREGSQHRGDRR